MIAVATSATTARMMQERCAGAGFFCQRPRQRIASNGDDEFIRGYAGLIRN
jgi:hypothetical protein